jgi:N-acetylglucosamine-6-phosphate deacetylase
MSLKVRGRLLASGENVEIGIERGLIQTVHPKPDHGQLTDAKTLWLAPAFFDIQVNGFAGSDFNSARVTSEEVEKAMIKLRERGVALFCPTVITQSFDHMASCFQALAKASDQAHIRGRVVPALHMEGPYISPLEGPRGAHNPEHIRPPNWDEFQRLQESANGLIGLLTLAPEVEGAIPFIEKVTRSGVLVAIGHTAAPKRSIQDAIGAGARLSTHLGNGSHAMLPRHQNYVWEQLAADELWASFIVDGHHLPPSVVKCLIRAKGIGRSILTSDAIAAAGMPPGRYRLGEIEVIVSPDFKVERAETAGSGYLAGSALDLLRGVENIVRFAKVGLPEAVQMASSNPATLMGIPDRIGRIEVGREANLILFQWDESSHQLTLKSTIQCGETVHQV